MMLYPEFVQENLIMDFNVSYKDSSGDISDMQRKMSLIALVKHMAIAGQGYMPHIGKLYRVLGMFLRFNDYLDGGSLRNNKFSLPRDYAYDPTEIAEFSNVVGKAFADYLVKEIDSAKVTFNYEAAMRKRGMKIEGKRPDLLCMCPQGRKIAIEAKGRKAQTVSESDMEEYKDQVRKGKISVENEIVSVAYNLYDRIKINYHDPEMGYFDEGSNFVKELIREYYMGVNTYLNENVFDITTVGMDGRKYYVLRPKLTRDSLRFPWRFCLIHCRMPLSLLLDCNIEEFAKSGEFDFSMKKVQERNVYIDTDGIGLMIDDYIFETE